jgi:hypothetical protein
MKVIYTLKNKVRQALILSKSKMTKNAIPVESTYFVLEPSKNLVEVGDCFADEVKTFLVDLKKKGLLEFSIQGEKVINIQDDQKVLKQSLLKDAKDIGLNVTNFMTVEQLQDAINKHLEQATYPQDNSNTQDDSDNTNQPNS